MLPTKPMPALLIENVERWERREGLLDGGFLGNIEDHGGSGGKLAGEGLSGVAVDIGDGDISAGRGQRAASGGADPAGAAGDQRFRPSSRKGELIL